MNRKFAIAGIILALGAALSACQWFAPRKPASTLSPEERVNTAAAQTVAAIGTEIYEGKNPTLVAATITPATITPAPYGTTPASTATPTDAAVSAGATTPAPASTASPEASGTPGPSPTGGPCTNQATYVRDVTIPDGALMLPRFTFVKTWELKNTGTCTWTPGYSVVFAKRGSAMDGAAATPILSSGEVKPGDSVQVSVTMRAPGQTGDYAGDWQLRSADNQLFGTGPAAASSFFVKITVEDTTFAFANYTCSAKWSTGAGDLPCPGKDGDSHGYILPSANPGMEDGQNREGPGWVVLPQPIGNGFIVGRFSALVVPEHADFRATISCRPDTPGCYVRFKVTYQVDNGPEQVLGEWNEGLDGNVTDIIKDLNMVGGKSTAFNFYVTVTGAPDQSRAVWFNPQIIKN